MKDFKKLFVAGSAIALALSACSMVDEYDQELFEQHEKAVEKEKQLEEEIADASCPETFTDKRDNKIYNIIRVYDVKVDTKARCWFKENLAYDDENAECYEGLKGESKKCKKYGRLYQGSKLAGVCPEGTHVATFADWQHLYKSMNIEKVKSPALKAEDDDWAEGDGKAATDEFGFSALPGGAYDEKLDEGFFSVGEAGYWWIVSGDKMSSISMHRDNNDVAYQNDVGAYKDLYYSVRCVIGKEADPSSSDSGDDEKQPTHDELVEMTDISISGYAQKGPFVKGSEVMAYHLDKNMKQIGDAYTGTVSDDKGKFEFTKIALSSQYALLKVKGYYNSEITGKISTATIELKSITDLSKQKVNINLLTHLEYDRLFYLVTEKNMSFTGAKKKAEEELFKIFHIDGSVFETTAEDMDVAGSTDADAALVAMSIMALGGNSEGEAQDILQGISSGIAKTGVLENDTLVARMADWVAEQEVKDHFESLRSNVSSKVGNFEKHLTNFWVGVYGMDTVSCAGDDDEGRIAYSTNKNSKNYKDSRVRYICKDSKWELANDLEKDTEGWKDGKDGDVKNGSVNFDSVYVFDGSWRKGDVLDSTLELRGCVDARDREVARGADEKWYICNNKHWVFPSTLDGLFTMFTPDDKLAFLNDKVTDIANDTMIDPRDGQVYRTVTIGDLVWMAENLNYSNEEDENYKGQSFCYDNLDYNCLIAGRLYTWTAAMNVAPEYQDKTLTARKVYDDDEITIIDNDPDGAIEMFENHQGICPDGWRLPTDVEIDYLESHNDITDLTSSFKDFWQHKGLNTYGLSLIPSGYRTEKSSYSEAKTAVYLWYSAEEASLTEASAAKTKGTALEYPNLKKNAAAAVRCVKDAE